MREHIIVAEAVWKGNHVHASRITVHDICTGIVVKSNAVMGIYYRHYSSYSLLTPCMYHGIYNEFALRIKH